MSARQVRANGHRRAPSRNKRPRSAVTSGRELFVGGDPNSAWARRFDDLIAGQISDLGGVDLLSEAQLSLIRRCAAIECELERLDARLSRNEAVDVDAYARWSGQLRRLFETLGLERRTRDVTPSLHDIIAEDTRRKLAAERAAAESNGHDPV